MVRANRFGDGDIAYLRSLFEETLILAHEVFGEQLFHRSIPKKATGTAPTKKPLGCSDGYTLSPSEGWVALRRGSRRSSINTRALGQHEEGTFTGRR